MEFVTVKVEESKKEDETCTEGNADSAFNMPRPLAFVEVKMETQAESSNNDLSEGDPVKEESIEEEECQVDSNADEDACLSVVNLKEDIEITVDEIKEEIQVPSDMPRRNLIPTKKSKRQSWDKENMANAIKAIKEKKMSIQKAGKIFSVPRSTLQRLSRMDKPIVEIVKIKLGRPTVLSKELEEELVKYLLIMEARFHGITKNDVRRMAYQLCTRNNIPHPFVNGEVAGRAWYEHFMSRHKDTLSILKPSARSISRAHGFNKKAVDCFFDSLEAEFKKQINPVDRVFNVNELGLSVGQSKTPRVIDLRGIRQVGALSAAEFQVRADVPKNSGVSSIKTAVNLDLTPEVPLLVKTPARTYQRPTPNRKRPLPWGAEENTDSSIKLGKTDNLSDKIKKKKIEGAVNNGVLTVDIQEGTCTSELTCNKNNKKKNKSKNIYLNPTYDIENCNNRRVYNRKHSCFICKEMHLKIYLHLLKRHHNKMSYISKLPVSSAVRREELIRLRRVGDMQHNVRVLRNGFGTLIVLRPSEKFIGKAITSEFLPCTFCMGFVHRSQLKRHHTVCVLKLRLEGLNENFLITSQATLMCTVSDYDLDKELLDLTPSTTKELRQTSIAKTVRNDPLINMLGKYMLQGEKSRTTSNEYAKRVVRKMACLMLTLKSMTRNKTITLMDCLAVNHLDMLISVVLSLLNSVSGALEKYELYKLYHSQIVNCIFGLRGKYLAEGKLVRANKLLEFYCQFNKGWQKIVISIFSSGNFSKRLILPDLPLMGNVINLKECLAQKVESITASLKEQDAIAKDILESWFVLAEKTMCLLCLYNATDFQLIESLTITDYALRPDWRVDKIKDYEIKMSSVPYHMAEKRFVVKTGQKETILLFTGVIKQAIDTLIAMRKTAGVCPENPYVFAEQFHSKNSLKAGVIFLRTCIEPMCGELNIDIMKNKSRQYLSYMTLISDMTPEEVEWLKKFHYNSTKKRNYLNIIFDPLAHAMHMHGFDLNLEEEICRNNTKKEEPICPETEPNPLSSYEPTATSVSAQKEPICPETEPDPLSSYEPTATLVSAQKEPICPETEPDPLCSYEPTATLVSAQKEPNCDQPVASVEQPTILKVSFPKGKGFSQDALKLAAVEIVNKRRKETVRTLGLPSKVKQISNRACHVTCVDLCASDVSRNYTQVTTNPKYRGVRPPVEESRNGKLRVNKKWSHEQLEYVRSYFQQHIINEKIPGMLECLICMDKRKNLLKGKRWTSIKSCVVAEIEHRLKIQQEDNPLFLD